MTRRVALGVFALLLVVSPLAGFAAAADTGASPSMASQANDTANWSSPGPFDYDYLNSNGRHPAEAPPSVRYIGSGDSPGGAVALRYRPTNPLDNQPVFLEPGAELNGDQLEIYSTIFGEATGEYEFVVVFWQQETRAVNGTTVTYAGDQEVQRIAVDLEDGYASADVSLKSHYDETWEVTAWLEQDGDLVPGAKWRFQHASLPASQQVQIDTRADAWWYALRTAILPGVAGIVLGLTGAQLTLRRTGDGPGYGLGVWGILGGLALLGALSGLYYEVAAVVAHFEILMGLSLGIIAYGGGLRMSPPTEVIRFPRKELQDARSLRDRLDEPPEDGDTVTDGGTAQGGSDVVEIPADGYKDELFEDEESLTTVRTEDGTRYVTKTGIRPFLSRLFANAAEVDLSSLATRVKVRDGDAAEKVFLDPDGDGLELSRARLKRRMPVWHRLPDDDDDELDLVTKGLYGGLTLAALALPAIGWHVGATTINAPMAGAAVGTVLLAVESYTAVDGRLDFTPAPRHFVSADASLTVLQNEYSDAKKLEHFQQIAWKERARSGIDMKETQDRRDDTMLRKLNESSLGIDVDVLGDPLDEEANQLDDDEHRSDGSTAKTATDGGEDGDE